MAVNVRCIRVEALERLMHDLHLRLEEFVVLVGFAGVVAFALESLDFGVELAFDMLGVADVLD